MLPAIETFELAYSLVFRSTELSSVVWDPDPKSFRIAAAGASGVIWLWRACDSAWTLDCELKGHREQITEICWSRSGKSLVSCDAAGEVRLWDLSTGEGVAFHPVQTSAVCSIAWALDDRHIVTGNEDGQLNILDSELLKVVDRLPTNKSPVRRVAIGGASSLIAVGDESGDVRIWPLKGEHRRASLALRGHNRPITGLLWSNDGMQIASTSEDRTLRVWDIGSTPVTHIVAEDANVINCSAWSPDGRFIALGSIDSFLQIRSVDNSMPPMRLDDHTGSVTSIAWHSSGLFFASVGQDGVVRIWDTLSWKTVVTLKAPFDSVWNVAWDSERKRALFTMPRDEAHIWDASVGSITQSFEESGHWPVCAAWGPAGTVDVVTGGFDGQATIWSSLTAKVERAFSGHSSAVCAVAWNPEGNKIASCTAKGTLAVWDARTLQEIITVKIPVEWITGLAWSPSGDRIALSGFENSVRVVDVPSGDMLRVLEHPGTTTAVAWYSDKILVSATESCELWVWDVETGERKSSHSVKAYGCQQIASIECLNAGKSEKYLSIGGRVWTEIISVAPSVNVVDTVTTTAKIVFAGDSYVGKTTLATKLSTGDFYPNAESTHGLKFHSLPPERVNHSWEVSDVKREIILWDMGGQLEYQLINQLFFPETSLALILVDPQRGSEAWRQAEYWSQQLAKQNSNQKLRKLLIGAKQEQGSGLPYPSGTLARCGFDDYIETGCSSGYGIDDLLQKLESLIVWEHRTRLATSEALISYVRDRWASGVVIIARNDVEAIVPNPDDLDAAIGFAKQQGVLVPLRTSTKSVFLRPDVVSEYAGSVLLAAKNNPVNVPAVELETLLASPFPRLTVRLSPDDHQVAVEAIVDLFFQLGICLEHGGRLIFPSCFDTSAPPKRPKPDRVYQVNGLVDSVYALLVTGLAYDQRYGSPRMWRHQAEWPIGGAAICGVRMSSADQVGRLELFYSTETTSAARETFAAQVERILWQSAAEATLISLGFKCELCEEYFGPDVVEQALRQRFTYLICRSNHKTAIRDVNLAEPASVVAQRGEQRNMAVRVRGSHQLLGSTASHKIEDPIRVLHLSDLHFSRTSDPIVTLDKLIRDLQGQLNVEALDLMIVSGDFVNKCDEDGYLKALTLLESLSKSFACSFDRLIIVPGNHDIDRTVERYIFENKRLIPDPETYNDRFQRFSDFHNRVFKKDYPLQPNDQFDARTYKALGIQVLGLNSANSVDTQNPKRPSIHAGALARGMMSLDDVQRLDDRQYFRIAVWHHALSHNEYFPSMKTDFLSELQKANFKVVMHGDVHQTGTDAIRYRGGESRRIEILGTGSFGADAGDLPFATGRLYSLVEIARNLKTARVSTRVQRSPEGEWMPHAVWGDGMPNPYFDLHFDLNRHE